MTKRNVPELRLEGFDGEWVEQRIHEVASVIGGGTPSTSVSEYWDGSIDWYSPSEIGNQAIAAPSERRISKAGLANSSANLLPPHKTILFTSRATIGHTAILAHPATTNQGFQSLVVNENTDPYFIYTLTPYIQHEALRLASGSTFLEISKHGVGNIMVRTPREIQEQEAIGAVFSDLDAVIEKHEQKHRTLQQTKSALMQRMFPQEGETEPRLRLKGFCGGWRETSIGDECDLLTGFPFPSDEFTKDGLLLVRGTNVKRGYIEAGADNTVRRSNASGVERYLLEENDILLQMDGALIGRSMSLMPKHLLPALLVQRVTRLRALPGNDQRFIYQCFIRDFLSYIGKHKTESAIPHLSGLDIKRFPIMLPPTLAEQEAIGAVFSKLDGLIAAEAKLVEKLKQTKTALLQKMFV